MNIQCGMCKFETSFNWKVFPVVDTAGKEMAGALDGLIFFYKCPKCENSFNIEVTFIPKKGFTSQIMKHRSDYIG